MEGHPSKARIKFLPLSSPLPQTHKSAFHYGNGEHTGISLVPVRCWAASVISFCGFRLRLPLVITACDYAPVNTHPVNTRIIFLRWYRRGGEGKEYEAKIEPIAPTTTALKNMLV